MKKPIISTLVTLAAIAAAQQAKATVLLSDNFNGYTAGNLVGQGGWAQTSTSTATPVQATGTAAAVGSSGQDVYDPLSSIYTMADNTSLYFGLTINVSAAQATGDYFFHFAPTVGETSAFDGRVFVKSTTGGYLLGYESTSGTGSAVTYGTTVLSLGTSYNLVLDYSDIAGALNDTASLYVNPTDPTEANNTAYLSNVAWLTSTAENHAVAEVNLRQGTASSAPTLTVDNIVVGTSFNDIVPAATPEPATLALAAMGGVACLFAVRRRK